MDDEKFNGEFSIIPAPVDHPETPPHDTDDTLPRVPVYLAPYYHYRRRFVVGWTWCMRQCPFCGEAHSHGGGTVLDGPASYLGTRLSHCAHDSSQYELVDEDPARTMRIKAEAQAEVRSAAARGVGLAQRIISQAGAELAARP